MKPFDPMRIDQGFNNPDSYGVGKNHEGIDVSLKGTWGNQDCGTPIKCIYPGEVVHSFNGTKNYGNMVVVESKTSRGLRWHMYCHLDERLVTSGLIGRGEVIGTMGSSGNSSHCHLHLQVWKKKPRNWRLYFKNVLKWYENPQLMMDADTIETPNMDTISDKNVKIDFQGATAGEGYETYNVLDIQTIESKLKDKDKHVKSLQDTQAAGMVILETERGRTTELQKENETLRLQNSEAVEDFDNLYEGFTEKVAELQDLEQENDDYEKEILKLHREVEDLTEEKLGKPFVSLFGFGIYRLP